MERGRDDQSAKTKGVTWTDKRRFECPPPSPASPRVINRGLPNQLWKRVIFNEVERPCRRRQTRNSHSTGWYCLHDCYHRSIPFSPSLPISILLATPSLSSCALRLAASFPKSLFRESFHAFSRWATATRARWGWHERKGRRMRDWKKEREGIVTIRLLQFRYVERARGIIAARLKIKGTSVSSDISTLRRFRPIFYPSVPIARSSTLAAFIVSVFYLGFRP